MPSSASTTSSAWRAGRLIDTFATRVGPLTAFPFLHRNLGRWALGRFVRAREALDEFIYEEIAIRRAEVEADDERARRRPLTAAARPL